MRKAIKHEPQTTGKERGRSPDGSNPKGKLLERNSAHLMKVLLTYFCMLRSISGYFTRRLLGESAEKDKQLVSDLKRVYRPDYSIIGFQLTARERLRLRDILNVSKPRTRDAVITHQHFFKNKVKAMKV